MVIDVGETVHVDVQQCGVETVTLGAFHGPLHVGAKADPVKGAGQRIAIGQLADGLLRVLELDAVVQNAVYEGIVQLTTYQVVLGAVVPQLLDGVVAKDIEQQDNRYRGIVFLGKAQQVFAFRSVGEDDGVDGRIQQRLQRTFNRFRGGQLESAVGTLEASGQNQVVRLVVGDDQYPVLFHRKP